MEIVTAGSTQRAQAKLKSRGAEKQVRPSADPGQISGNPIPADQVTLSANRKPELSKIGAALGVVVGGAAGIAAGRVSGLLGAALGLPAAVAGAFMVGGAAYALAKNSESHAIQDGAGPLGGGLGFVGTAAAAALGGTPGAAVVGLGTAAFGGLLGGALGNKLGLA